MRLASLIERCAVLHTNLEACLGQGEYDVDPESTWVDDAVDLDVREQLLARHRAGVLPKYEKFLRTSSGRPALAWFLSP